MMFGYYQDPLHQFHNLLRMGRMDGYPNLIYANPHPYEMSMNAGIKTRNRFPFRYGQGRDMRMGMRSQQPQTFNRQLGPVLGGVRGSHQVGIGARPARNFRLAR